MGQARRVQTASVSELLPGVTVSFNSKPPHARFDVVFCSPVGQEISDELSSAVQATGFNQHRKQAQQNGVVSLSFEREGSGLCGGWTAAERERLTTDASLRVHHGPGVQERLSPLSRLACRIP